VRFTLPCCYLAPFVGLFPFTRKRNMNNHDFTQSDFFITSSAQSSFANDTIHNNVSKRLRIEGEKNQKRLRKFKEKSFQLSFAPRKNSISLPVVVELRKTFMKTLQNELDEKRAHIEELELEWRERQVELNRKRLVLKQRINLAKTNGRYSQRHISIILRKANEEAKCNQRLQEQITSMMQEIEKLMDQKEVIEKKLKNIMRYQTFLESVCIEELYFSEIDTILKRYERLMSINNEIKNHIYNSKQELIDVNSRIKKDMEDHQIKIFEFNSKITQAIKELDKIIKERKISEEQVFIKTREKLKNERLISKIEMSITNLNKYGIV
jgi:flagellar biosynthesis chaperone FliJ